MLKFTEMDSNVTLIQQMEADISPVVLINRFTVTPEEVDQLLKAWEQTPPSSRHNPAAFPLSFTVESAAVAAL
jgi:hypothetical protein